MYEAQLRLTDDGSHTLYSRRVDECYHSTYGAVQESRHVFLEAGWRHCSALCPRVLEVGLGTGLNAFLTLQQAALEERRVFYTALERYPVSWELACKLNYPDMDETAGGEMFMRLHQAGWGKRERVTPWFDLLKRESDFTKAELDGQYDLVYFDAFSPEKQPEMWTAERFSLLYRHAAAGAVLVTYCAKGAVRRALQAAGFSVERLPGPPGKREMLRAVK